MKKIILGLFVSTIITVGFLTFFNKNKSSTKFSRYIIEGQIYHLLVAKNPAQWRQGLMYYKSKEELKGADGMIFIFPDKQIKSFWNKNTYLDLDLYWMDGDKVVGNSYLPSIIKTKNPLTVNSPREVDRVAEIIR
jgi:hypothetical protein